MTYLILLLLLFTPSAWAEDSSHLQGTRITLTTTASLTLPNDEAIIHYRMEASGRNSELLRAEVNRISNALQTRLKQEKDLKQTTLSRRMEPIWRYDKSQGRQLREGWRLVQSEQITTRALDAIPNWLNNIEAAGAHLDALNFHIADATMEAAQTDLRLKAVAQFRQQAASLAQALDATSFRILELNPSQERAQQPVMRHERVMMQAAADSAPPPSLNSGEGEISVQIHGTILLPVKDYTDDSLHKSVQSPL